jgi:acetoacetyl-CoA synthetase
VNDAAGQLLWEPADDARATTRMGAFMDAAEEAAGRSLGDYNALWRWSVDDLDGFWSLIASELGVRWHTPPTTMLGDASMPGAVWAPGGTLNYAEHALAGGAGADGGVAGDAVALVCRSQTRANTELSWDALRDQVARCRAGLVRLGVTRGDRVAAYLPNIPETIVAFLATASLGAIWSSCAPEFGVEAVVDRVAQLEPKVLLVIDGYRYGDKLIDRRTHVAAIRAALPTVQGCVLVPYLDPDAALPDAIAWDALLAEPATMTYESVPFDQPLYALYSSGTTGKPKAIVHGHGGILLEHLKVLGLHHDLAPGDRFFWFTTTGWMMWNYLVSGLAVGATLVLFDGDPGHPDLSTLWQLAADDDVTVFGVSAPFLLSCRTAGLTPGTDLDLSTLRAVGSTGAPLPPEGFIWVHDAVGQHVHIGSASGGTDVCTAFVLGAPLLPVRAGEIAARGLGCDIQAWAPDRTSLVGERGELIIAQPMPSFPVSFWDDEDGARYHAAYFEEFPGAWRHGDWLTVTDAGACIISGRSDATLNRGGVRMGTAEFYSVVEELPQIADSLVVHLEDLDGGPGRLVLCVVLAEGATMNDELRRSIATAIRAGLSPRHVPDELHVVPDVPRTLSGKKLEVPVKRLLLGEPLADVLTAGALKNPEVLAAYTALV